jgi:hypothetical protein
MLGGDDRIRRSPTLTVKRFRARCDSWSDWLDEMSMRSGVPPPAAANQDRHPLAGPWVRWLGPTILLLTGSTCLTLALLHKPPAVTLIPLCGLAALGPAAEAPFLTENDAAMSKMLTDMTVQPTGDVDHDFVEMMVPHHQGAIDMAQALLSHGHNEPLRRLAQEIIVTQQQEIAAMRLALGEPLPPMTAAPDQPASLSTIASKQISNP